LEYIALATACALMSLPGGSETRRLAAASALTCSHILTCSHSLRVFLPALTDGSGSRYADAMARRDLIAEKLTKAFAPASLDVVDESHQHAGHAGHREGGETHFRVYIVAEVFRGKSRVERHRMINAAASTRSLSMPQHRAKARRDVIDRRGEANLFIR
jgi:BolA family transcriptional regulator, general stress-responsive regulator